MGGKGVRMPVRFAEGTGRRGSWKGRSGSGTGEAAKIQTEAKIS
ncbi:hypothetical protein B4135_0403 [Caldibacillus debilis]|uniref:Uncharacterized protein n=1 Tax=Caldibacillus debilis TaxID=301148 RepID=A0A150LAG5_9BACI|nr:hypothetical protein B4135_0403 [Caldibacillus debilis]